MSTACQQQLVSYDQRRLHTMNYHNPFVTQSHPERTTSFLSNGVRQSNHEQLHQQQPQQQQKQQPRYPTDPVFQPAFQSLPQPRNYLPEPAMANGYASRHSTGPSTPASEGAMGLQPDEVLAASGPASLVMHSLSMPECITTKGGSLVDFAANMTCFFWFETAEVLQAAGKVRSKSPPAIRSLAKYSIPLPQYRKWVYNLISTTQVTQNVILMALLFMYRLKMNTLSVRGRQGSEYRLLTVALMLGNKFLDDNTYTNKTWAEVSHLSVQDIHVMEVEFLSNMRYSLYTSKEEWEEWLAKLSSFYEYFDKAARLPSSPQISIPSPNGRLYASPIPSPTTGVHNHVLPSTPTAVLGYASTGMTNSQTWPSQPVAHSSPLSNKPSMNHGSRKRSFDGDATEPPAKRAAHQPYPAVVRPQVTVEPIRLPVPSLTINTNPIPYNPGNTITALPQMSLPPLVPGVRAMATVFPGTAVSVTQQLPIPSTAGPPSMPPTTFAATGMPPHPSLGYSTPTKHQSPGGLAVYNSSPLVESFHNGSGVHTPISHSPSIYLQHRNSPYKPIRHVNTLLYPPPSASLQEYHLSVTPSQMYYQPLGRRNDVRNGVVPDYQTIQAQQAQQAQRHTPTTQGGFY